MRVAVLLLTLAACASPPTPERAVPAALQPFAEAARFLPAGLSSYAFGFDWMFEPKRVLVARAGSDFMRPQGTGCGRFHGVEVLDFGPDGIASAPLTDPGPPSTSIGGTPVWKGQPSNWRPDPYWWADIDGRYRVWSHDLEVLGQALARRGNLPELLAPFPLVADIADDTEFVVCLLPRPDDQTYWGRPVPAETTVVAISQRSGWLVAYHHRPLPKEFADAFQASCEASLPAVVAQGELDEPLELVLRKGTRVGLLFDSLFGYAIML